MVWLGRFSKAKQSCTTRSEAKRHNKDNKAKAKAKAKAKGKKAQGTRHKAKGKRQKAKGQRQQMQQMQQMHQMQQMQQMQQGKGQTAKGKAQSAKGKRAKGKRNKAKGRRQNTKRKTPKPPKRPNAQTPGPPNANATQTQPQQQKQKKKGKGKRTNNRTSKAENKANSKAKSKTKSKAKINVKSILRRLRCVWAHEPCPRCGALCVAGGRGELRFRMVQALFQALSCKGIEGVGGRRFHITCGFRSQQRWCMSGQACKHLPVAMQLHPRHGQQSPVKKGLAAEAVFAVAGEAAWHCPSCVMTLAVASTGFCCCSHCSHIFLPLQDGGLVATLKGLQM